MRTLPILIAVALAGPVAAEPVVSPLVSMDQVGAAALALPPVGSAAPDEQRIQSLEGDGALVGQTGLGETAAVTQSGLGDAAAIGQSGTGESATIVQTGGNDIASIVQASAGARAAISQAGFGDVARVRQ